MRSSSDTDIDPSFFFEKLVFYYYFLRLEVSMKPLQFPRRVSFTDTSQFRP